MRKTRLNYVFIPENKEAIMIRGVLIKKSETNLKGLPLAKNGTIQISFK